MSVRGTEQVSLRITQRRKEQGSFGCQLLEEQCVFNYFMGNVQGTG